MTHLWPLCALRSPASHSWWWWLAGWWWWQGSGTLPGSAVGRGQSGSQAGSCWCSLGRPWCRSLAWWFEVTGAGLLWVPAGCWQASLEQESMCEMNSSPADLFQCVRYTGCLTFELCSRNVPSESTEKTTTILQSYWIYLLCFVQSVLPGWLAVWAGLQRWSPGGEQRRSPTPAEPVSPLVIGCRGFGRHWSEQRAPPSDWETLVHSWDKKNVNVRLNLQIRKCSTLTNDLNYVLTKWS